MGRIPEDAKHWDSGDWIEWHRTGTGIDQSPCSAAAQDPQARLAAMLVSMLRASKGYFEMTGHHLPLYENIAHVHAAMHFDLPLEGPDRTADKTGVEVLFIPPHGPTNIVHVNLSSPFKTLIVVRIKDNFTTEARVMSRSTLPDKHDEAYPLSWQSMPNGH